MENLAVPSRGNGDGQPVERVGAAIMCEVKQGSRPWKAVRIEDISMTGCRIACYPECRPEIAVRIRIPGLQLLNAHVRWMEGAVVGCEFTQPLHIAVFDHIARQSGKG